MFLLGNGRVITRDAAQPFLPDGAVVIDGGKILAAGPRAELQKAWSEAEFVDAGGGIIMPGLINAHHHIYSAFARGLSIRGNHPANFLEILEGTWWRLDRSLTLEDVYESARVTFLDCIRHGVTTVFDHHASYGAIAGSLFRIADAARELGLRSCLCYEISDRDGREKMQQALQENCDFLQAAAHDHSDMQKAMLGLHASFTLSDTTLQLCREKLPANMGSHIHVAEGLADVQQTLQKHAKRIVHRLYDFDLLGPRTIAAHCIHINEAELELLRDTHTMVVHNPESNMDNAVGCPPALAMQHKGILVGLGTDGYTNDMLESYKAGNLLHKHSLCDPAVGWSELPQMLFAGNAELANRYFAVPLGVLRAGAAADIIVLDYEPYTPMDAANCNAHLLFGTNGRSVKTTIVNGKVLMQDRRLLADEEEILAKARERSAGLWQRINA